MTTPEIKEAPPVETPKAVTEAETPKEIPVVEEKATTQTPGQVAAQVAATQQPQAQAPVTPTVTVTVPATTQQLTDWSKGSAEDSLTWLAFYWIRIIKKALLHGFRVITQVPSE